MTDKQETVVSYVNTPLNLIAILAACIVVSIFVQKLAWQALEIDNLDKRLKWLEKTVYTQQENISGKERSEDKPS